MLFIYLKNIFFKIQTKNKDGHQRNVASPRDAVGAAPKCHSDSTTKMRQTLLGVSLYDSFELTSINIVNNIIIDYISGYFNWPTSPKLALWLPSSVNSRFQRMTLLLYSFLQSTFHCITLLKMAPKYDKQQVCYYCEKKVSKIVRHYICVHNDQKPIILLNKLPRDDPGRRHTLEKLRNLGHFKYNSQVLRGELDDELIDIIDVDFFFFKETTYRAVTACVSYTEEKCIAIIKYVSLPTILLTKRLLQPHLCY